MGTGTKLLVVGGLTALLYTCSQSMVDLKETITGEKKDKTPTTPEETFKQYEGYGEHSGAAVDGYTSGIRKWFGISSEGSEEGSAVDNSGGSLEDRCFVINGVEQGNCPER